MEYKGIYINDLIKVEKIEEVHPFFFRHFDEPQLQNLLSNGSVYQILVIDSIYLFQLYENKEPLVVEAINFDCNEDVLLTKLGFGDVLGTANLSELVSTYFG